MAKPANGGVAALQYDAEEQSGFIDQLQTASAKLFALLDHISGEGFEAFSESENQHGLLWTAQGLAEEVRDISERLMTSRDGLPEKAAPTSKKEMANGH